MTARAEGGRAALGRATVLAAALLLGALAVVVAYRAPQDAGAAPSLDAEEQAFLVAINEYRAGQGLGPLSVGATLQEAARWMSQDMASGDYFSHTDSLGRDPFQRMADFGYAHNTWKGENLAAGVSGGQAAFDLWKDSPGHNTNMLNPHYRVIGIARAFGAGSTFGWYWTTDFGGEDDPSPPAEPTPAPPPSPEPDPGASPTPAPVISGDMDCDAGVNSVDALLVLRMVAEMPQAASCAGQPQAADVDCDGEVDSADALMILRHVAQLADQPPAGCPPVSSSRT